jgi:hypothetical protein
MENIVKSWDKLRDSFEELEGSLGKAYDELREMRSHHNEMKAILKSIVDNGGMMTPMQIMAVTKYYGWEIK